MPRGWYGRGFGMGRRFGGGFGFGRGGYCWEYYLQTGQFPPWSPWSGTEKDLESYLEGLKKMIELRLKEIREKERS